MNNTPASRIQVPTPFGPFTIIHRNGAILSAGWDQTLADQLRFIHPSLKPCAVYDEVTDTTGYAALATSFFTGQIPALPSVPTQQAGGPFTQRVWAAIHDIPPGEVVTYGELAAMAGNPLAVRAAASACAKNPIALFVPCHRICAAGGKPGGYRYGLPLKAYLLALERPEEDSNPRPIG